MKEAAGSGAAIVNGVTVGGRGVGLAGRGVGGAGGACRSGSGVLTGAGVGVVAGLRTG